MIAGERSISAETRTTSSTLTTGFLPAYIFHVYNDYELHHPSRPRAYYL